jgi:hypothetical protein
MKPEGSLPCSQEGELKQGGFMSSSPLLPDDESKIQLSKRRIFII